MNKKITERKRTVGACCFRQAHGLEYGLVWRPAMNSDQISIRKEHENRMLERRNEARMEEHKLADLKRILQAKIQTQQGSSRGIRAA